MKKQHTEITDTVRLDGNSDKILPDTGADKTRGDDQSDKTIKRDPDGMSELAVDPDWTKPNTPTPKKPKEDFPKTGIKK